MKARAERPKEHRRPWHVRRKTTCKREEAKVFFTVHYATTAFRRVPNDEDAGAGEDSVDAQARFERRTKIRFRSLEGGACGGRERSAAAIDEEFEEEEEVVAEVEEADEEERPPKAREKSSIDEGGGDSMLARYFREMATHVVMGPDEELETAIEVEVAEVDALDLRSWRIIPAAEHALESLAAARSSRRVKMRSTCRRSKSSSKYLQALQEAAKQAHEVNKRRSTAQTCESLAPRHSARGQ